MFDNRRAVVMEIQGGVPQDKGEAAPDNQRRSVRLPCAGARCQFGAVMDLSKSGCRVLAKKPLELPAGATVNLRLETHGVTLLVPGRPVCNRKRPDGRVDIGFEFVITGPEMASDLMEFVRVSLANHEYMRRSA